MKLKKSCLVLLFLAGTNSAYAVSLDYRHEYTDVDKTNKDRLLITHRFGNGFGFGLEAMWKNSGENKDIPFNDMVSNGTELTLGYQFPVNSGFKLQPVFVMTSNSNSNGYKPGLYGSYQLTDSLTLSARYRWEYIRHVTQGVDDDRINRADIWVAYTQGQWKYEYNYFYIGSDSRLRYNNRKWDYENSLKVQYAIDKAWAPYVGILNKSVKGDSSARQTGFRVGLQYSF
ncbi:Oligogalacturonate-specific porin kdgM precursor [Serratia fonticola]|uniref:oligogalacturonate-specific porin KdgM family protein n=1 Tax=Serratia fonticola TaxID=47917 RepID=UPI0021830A2F|nr:oligogalacturonate-specific porin KdgM family protein [Serratia fonticola]CAI2017447.1 Oligogalacturonate-specific porin kdgM precursor [Serratia fonticola]